MVTEWLLELLPARAILTLYRYRTKPGRKGEGNVEKGIVPSPAAAAGLRAAGRVHHGCGQFAGLLGLWCDCRVIFNNSTIIKGCKVWCLASFLFCGYGKVARADIESAPTV